VKYRNFAHYLVGVLMVLGALISPAIPIVLLLLFLVYEVDEDWHLYDQAYRDILEAMIGFFVATSAIIVWRVVL